MFHFFIIFRHNSKSRIYPGQWFSQLKLCHQHFQILTLSSFSGLLLSVFEQSQSKLTFHNFTSAVRVPANNYDFVIFHYHSCMPIPLLAEKRIDNIIGYMLDCLNVAY